MRSINNQIFMAHKYIEAKIWSEPNQTFPFRERFENENNMDTFFAWQLEINTEMSFVKMYVFLEYLRKLGIEDEYKINKPLLTAGFRAYVAHTGTQQDFHQLCLPINTLAVADKLEIENGEIFFTLLSGDHTQQISNTTTHRINLTKEFFKPHFDYINEKYPEWLQI